MDIPSPDFEPLQRARSNTWPLPKPEPIDENGCPIPVPPDIKSELNEQEHCILSAIAASSTSAGMPPTSNNVSACLGLLRNGTSPGTIPAHSSGSLCSPNSSSGSSGGISHCSGTVKKNSSRRNAWGNLSYADLITRAISSAPENRLTLSQIYEWMVHNVPYFKDKGDNNSSAGWKNSIRHNLSLHNRFIRVQNEGTGKSSWWMLNPDAKPGKSARRRATSMETSKFEKRRGRIKKKLDDMRVNPTSNSTSMIATPPEPFDMFAESSPLRTFQHSPDFRTRASSNASSSSRLSPILSVENEWSKGYGDYLPTDQLAGNLEHSMKLTHMDSYMYHNSPSAYDQHMAELPPPPHIQQVQHFYHPSYIPQGPQFAVRSEVPPIMENSQYSSPVDQNNSLDDLNIDTINGEFECNVEEVIRHELSIEGKLEFNFSMPSIPPNISTSKPSTPPPPPGPPPYSRSNSFAGQHRVQ